MMIDGQLLPFLQNLHTPHFAHVVNKMSLILYIISAFTSYIVKVSFNLLKVVSHHHKQSAKMSDNLKDISSALDTQKVRGAAAVDDKLTVVIS